MKRSQTVAEVLYGRKTERRYDSEKGREVVADHVSLSCQVSISVKPRYEPLPERLRALLAPCFYPLKPPKTPNLSGSNTSPSLNAEACTKVLSSEYLLTDRMAITRSAQTSSMLVIEERGPAC